MIVVRAIGRGIGSLLVALLSGVLMLVAFLDAGGGHEWSETMVRLRGGHEIDGLAIACFLGSLFVAGFAGGAIGGPSWLRWPAGALLSAGLTASGMGLYYMTDHRFSSHEPWPAMFGVAAVLLVGGLAAMTAALVARVRKREDPARGAV